MRILISNDDGIDAAGLRTLAAVLGREHEVYVCAPASERSSFSHSVTYWRLRNRAWEREVDGAAAAWAVDATPADCVYYGVHAFMEWKPDLIVSGINRGENLTTDCVYSGTVGAAMEGMLMGIPSMAVSCCSYEGEHYETAALAAAELIPLFMAERDRDSFVLNVNVPAVSPAGIRGVRVTSFDGVKDYRKRIVQERQADGSLLLTCPNQPAGIRGRCGTEDADVTAVENGFVSVTPLYADMVDHCRCREMRHWNDVRLFCGDDVNGKGNML